MYLDTEHEFLKYFFQLNIFLLNIMLLTCTDLIPHYIKYWIANILHLLCACMCPDTIFTFSIILYMLTFCNFNYIYCQPPYHLLTCEHYSAVQCMYAHIFTQLVCACVHRINFWQPFQLCILFVKTLYFKLLFIWGLFINYFCVQMMQL